MVILLSISTVKKFTTGIPGLDRLLSEVVTPYIILVAGHPGAGKTTMATTICHANALQGKKCLYITFYEDREKYYKFMKRLGLNLELLESMRLFKFTKLPLTLDVELLVNEISKAISEGCGIIVIDSISVLLEPVMNIAEKRAWLLNYFYQLPALLSGLVVLVAELLFGEEKLGLGSVEFVVDAIVLLKHRIEDGFLTRIVEVRKARGAPIHIAETYFTIAEGMGVVVFVPPLLGEIPYEHGELIPACGVLEKTIGHCHKGFLVNVFYPQPGAGFETLLGVLALAVRNNMKALVVSYIYPSHSIIEVLKHRLARIGLSGESLEKLLRKHMNIVSLNPFAHSLTQLAARELTLIEQFSPDIVVFYGVHLPRSTSGSYTEFLKELFNQVMYLKSKGITVFRVGSCLDDYSCNAEASISDVTYRFERTIGEDGNVNIRAYVYRRFRSPAVLSGKEVSEYIEECEGVIREHVRRL